MPETLFYHFAYMLQDVVRFLGRSDSFEDVIHMTRDGAAFAEVQAMLGESLHWKYGGVILNLPASEVNGRGFAPAPLYDGEHVFALVGRPPLDDERRLDRRIVFRSDSPVERMVLARLRQAILWSTRKAIILADGLSLTNAMRAVMFRINNREGGRPATIYRHGDCLRPTELEVCEEHSRDDTVGYLIWVPGDREAGIPGILCIFGMGGAETLLWAAYVRRRAVDLVRSLVAENRLRVMAARFTRPVMETIPIDLSFVDDWGEIEWILDSKRDSKRGPERAARGPQPQQPVV